MSLLILCLHVWLDVSDFFIIFWNLLLHIYRLDWNCVKTRKPIWNWPWNLPLNHDVAPKTLSYGRLKVTNDLEKKPLQVMEPITRPQTKCSTCGLATWYNNFHLWLDHQSGAHQTNKKITGVLLSNVNFWLGQSSKKSYA